MNQVEMVTRWARGNVDRRRLRFGFSHTNGAVTCWLWSCFRNAGAPRRSFRTSRGARVFGHSLYFQGYGSRDYSRYRLDHRGVDAFHPARRSVGA